MSDDESQLIIDEEGAVSRNEVRRQPNGQPQVRQFQRNRRQPQQQQQQDFKRELEKYQEIRVREREREQEKIKQHQLAQMWRVQNRQISMVNGHPVQYEYQKPSKPINREDQYKYNQRTTPEYRQQLQYLFNKQAKPINTNPQAQYRYDPRTAPVNRQLNFGNVQIPITTQAQHAHGHSVNPQYIYKQPNENQAASLQQQLDHVQQEYRRSYSAVLSTPSSTEAKNTRQKLTTSNPPLEVSDLQQKSSEMHGQENREPLQYAQGPVLLKSLLQVESRPTSTLETLDLRPSSENINLNQPKLQQPTERLEKVVAAMRFRQNSLSSNNSDQMPALIPGPDYVYENQTGMPLLNRAEIRNGHIYGSSSFSATNTQPYNVPVCSPHYQSYNNGASCNTPPQFNYPPPAHQYTKYSQPPPPIDYTRQHPAYSANSYPVPALTYDGGIHYDLQLEDRSSFSSFTVSSPPPRPVPTREDMEICVPPKRQIKCKYMLGGCLSGYFKTQYECLMHEITCPYRCIKCFFNSCNWSAPLLELSDHIKLSHRSCVNIGEIFNYDISLKELRNRDKLCYVQYSNNRLFIIEMHYKGQLLHIATQLLPERKKYGKNEVPFGNYNSKNYLDEKLYSWNGYINQYPYSFNIPTGLNQNNTCLSLPIPWLYHAFYTSVTIQITLKLLTSINGNSNLLETDCNNTNTTTTNSTLSSTTPTPTSSFVYNDFEENTITDLEDFIIRDLDKPNTISSPPPVSEEIEILSDYLLHASPNTY